MKQTYITKMPDKAGAFLAASRVIRENSGNITRVSYNKAVDVHTLFIEVSAGAEQHARIARSLTELGYLTGDSAERRVILIELKLPDRPGTVEPVLEVINGYDVNISYLSSQEDGTPYQSFKMGLLIENPREISRLLDDLSRLCGVRILDYDVTEKQLDGTVFYISFADEMRALLGLTQELTNTVLIQSNRIMQTLDERGGSPLKTFGYIRRFAEFVAGHRGENYHAEVSCTEPAPGLRLYTVQPPCGSNTFVLESGGELLCVDCGFACYREELLGVLRGLFPDFDSRRKSLVLTHADIDHAGLTGLFDRVYMSRSCYENFLLEQRWEPNFREQNPLHAPYCVLSKIISGYTVPSLDNARVVGAKEDGELLTRIGELRFGGYVFDLYEGAGGHVRGETVMACEALRLVFTGDVLVNIQGFSEEQRAFNLLAPYLMTSVNVDSKLAKAVRELVSRRFRGFGFFPGHGAPIPGQTDAS